MSEGMAGVDVRLAFFCGLFCGFLFIHCFPISETHVADFDHGDFSRGPRIFSSARGSWCRYPFIGAFPSGRVVVVAVVSHDHNFGGNRISNGEVNSLDTVDSLVVSFGYRNSTED